MSWVEIESIQGVLQPFGKDTVMGTIGAKRYGMSMIVHRLVDCYYRKGYKMVNLNDRLNEFGFLDFSTHPRK